MYQIDVGMSRRSWYTVKKWKERKQNVITKKREQWVKNEEEKTDEVFRLPVVNGVE